MILETEKNGKKKAQVKQEKSPRAKAKYYVVIDHPKNGETLTHPHYAVRVGASADHAEISIDGSGWKACRPAAGYFWFDWAAIPSGPHKLTARVKTAGGKAKSSKAVQCKMK